MPPATESSAGDTHRARSASAIVGGSVSGQHLLYVDSYSRAKAELPTGESIDSRPFTVGGLSWRVRLYPNGRNSWFAEFVSVVLVLDEDASAAIAPLKVRARFSLLDQAGSPVRGFPKTVDHEFRAAAGSGCGVGNFINRDLLEKSEHLLDDRIRISCDLIVFEKLCAEDRVAPGTNVAVPPSDLSRHLGDLLRTKDGADVTFQVAGEAFRAHRFLLVARSPVFKAQLLGGMKESTATAIGDSIQIDDMLPQVFDALLHYVYTDSLPETMEGQEGVVMAQHLLEAADRYDMHRLKLICADKLCGHLDAGMAATALVLAEKHSCQGLKEACIEFLKSPDSLEAAMETDGFDHLTRSCPSLVKELLYKLTTPSKRRKLTNDTGK